MLLVSEMNSGVQDKNGNLSVESALEQLNETQSMIDFMICSLVDLREPKVQFSEAVFQEYIVREIRSYEGKLIKEFCKQLSTKRRVTEKNTPPAFQNFPLLNKWLTAVGVGEELKSKFVNGSQSSVESLMKLPSSDLGSLIDVNGGTSEDKRKLGNALKQLKKYQDGGASKGNMFWDSWNKFQSNETKITVNDEANISIDYNENVKPANNQLIAETSTKQKENSTVTVSVLSPPSPLYSSRSSLSSGGPPSPYQSLRVIHHNGSVPQTPPFTEPQMPLHFQHALESQLADLACHSGASTPQPSRNLKIQDKLNHHHHRKSSSNAHNPNTISLPFASPLRSSKSTEWQVGNHITTLGCSESLTASNQSLSSINTLPPPNSSTSKLFSSSKRRKKRPKNLDLTIDGNEFNLIELMRQNPVRRMSATQTVSPESSSSIGISNSPLSPKTPVTPGTPHNPEMWVKQTSIAAANTSSYPQTPKTPKGIRGGIRAIKDVFKRRNKMKRNKSEDLADSRLSTATPKKTRSQTDPSINTNNIKLRHGHLSSTSVENQSKIIPTSSVSVPNSQTIERDQSRDLHLYEGQSNAWMEQNVDANSNDMTFHACTDESASVDKINNEPSYMDAGGGMIDDAAEDSGTGEFDPEMEAQFARQNLMRQASTMSAMSEEWDIPYEELEFEELIGCGRVGKVWRGRWHGEVAIRVIDISHNDEEKLRAFKHEVMLYKKTRHENIELFMGSCMKPPHLAIVTGFCKGRSLFQHIRQSKEHTVNINNAKIIAQHIAQGMGYLHSRRIIHKDLKSKNIFVDGKRVVITDFGLMGLHAVASKSIVSIKPYTLQIPDGWLCYMAPEVIRSLHVPEHGDVIANLPYTKESDVYAFGTVWYELLTGCWPFQDYDDCAAEKIIWQVGHGKKQSLGSLQAPKELKEILMCCWAYDPLSRPDFSDNGVMGLLLKLPIAKIMRRLSQPTGGKRGGRGGHDRFLDLPALKSSQFGSLHDLAE